MWALCRYDQLRQELSEAQELASAEEQRRVVDAATQAISRLGEALNPSGISRAQRVVQTITEPSQVSCLYPGWQAWPGTWMHKSNGATQPGTAS